MDDAMVELEVVTISDKQYLIIKEMPYEGVTYLALSNIADENDFFFRKMNGDDKDTILPLESDEEFNLVCELLLKSEGVI